MDFLFISFFFNSDIDEEWGEWGEWGEFEEWGDRELSFDSQE